MIASISHFIFSLVNNNKTEPFLSSQPRFVFVVKNLDSLYLFKTDVHVDLVKLEFFRVISQYQSMIDFIFLDRSNVGVNTKKCIF